MPNIAIIEDNEILRTYIAVILQRAGFRVQTFRDVPDLEEVVAKQMPYIVISDIYLPTGSGVDLVKKLKKKHPRIKVIMMSSDTITLREEGTNLADAILPKPFSAADLLLSLQPLLESGSRSEYPKPRID